MSACRRGLTCAKIDLFLASDFLHTVVRLNSVHVPKQQAASSFDPNDRRMSPSLSLALEFQSAVHHTYNYTASFESREISRLIFSICNAFIPSSSLRI